MNQQSTVTPTLFTLLAREWATGADITAMQFNACQSAVAFALANGSVAIASASDDDPPEQRIHVSAEDGRSTIRPRSKATAPLRIAEISDGGEVLICAIGEEDFAVCGSMNEAFRIGPDGQITEVIEQISGPTTALVRCPASNRIGHARGTQVSVCNTDEETPSLRLDLGEPVSALAFSPDGQRTAIAHDYGLTVWDHGSEAQETADFPFSGKPSAIAWSPDGQWIATPLAAGGFQLTHPSDGRTGALTDYPAPVRSIAWNASANALISSGAFRVAAWSMNAPPIDDPSVGAIETGRAGLVPVCAVSSHPNRDLAAAGYDNGIVTIVQIGGRDELVLHGEDRGAVTRLEWSQTGRHLAFATDRQMAAVVSLPPQMFK